MSLFVSSCTRRQWARRRAGRSRRWSLHGPATPMLMTASLVAVALGAFFAGRGL